MKNSAPTKAGFRGKTWGEAGGKEVLRRARNIKAKERDPGEKGIFAVIVGNHLPGSVLRAVVNEKYPALL